MTIRTEHWRATRRAHLIDIAEKWSIGGRLTIDYDELLRLVDLILTSKRYYPRTPEQRLYDRDRKRKARAKQKEAAQKQEIDEIYRAGASFGC